MLTSSYSFLHYLSRQVLSKGDLNLGGSTIKIGDGEVEVKTGKDGKRNYVDISDNSAFTLPTMLQKT
ncbi:hypothetical protein [Wolbachia endosymbiont (group B) of Horisme vitalbata]|uniref:hypothetical protein n=1 Tax=Wolbachia endosymbiont (group B) of Horisme vitalbata TaxID=3066178 RepID=UPI00333F1222